MKSNPRDPYREWSYGDRCDASSDRALRDAVQQYDKDEASSDAAYFRWLNGGPFSDPNPDGRFHQ
jgi:hypothetical protein